MRRDPITTTCALGLAFMAIVAAVLGFGAAVRLLIVWWFFP